MTPKKSITKTDNKAKAVITKKGRKQSSPTLPQSTTKTPDAVELVITDEMNRFMQLVEETDNCIFLTGKAGTGKSSLLRHLLKTTKKNVVVAAPTGVAAVNVGGVTLHSLFQIPFGPYMPHIDLLGQTHDALPSYRFSDAKASVIRKMELLVIDEVSMLRADVLDAVNDVLCHVRKNPSPFGGVQVVFIGDLYQLPPVIKPAEWKTISSAYSVPFFFGARVLDHVHMQLVSLSHVFRQTDDRFISMLNDIREGQLSPSSFTLLSSLYRPDCRLEGLADGFVILTTHNAKADAINKQKLADLSGQEKTYTARLSGNFSSSSLPADFELTLKVGAKVMLLCNDNETHLYHNGSTGVVVSLMKDSVNVRLDACGIEVEISRHKWASNVYDYNKESKRIESRETGSFTQLPLRLAWAVTIHKSQGMTFDKLVIDAEKSFTAGQVYVALSRATGTQNLVLSSPIRSESIQVNAEILNFF